MSTGIRRLHPWRAARLTDRRTRIQDRRVGGGVRDACFDRAIELRGESRRELVLKCALRIVELALGWLERTNLDA